MKKLSLMALVIASLAHPGHAYKIDLDARIKTLETERDDLEKQTAVLAQQTFSHMSRLLDPSRLKCGGPGAAQEETLSRACLEQEKGDLEVLKEISKPNPQAIALNRKLLNVKEELVKLLEMKLGS